MAESQPRLIAPTASYKQSYIEAVDEGFMLGGIEASDHEEQYRMMKNDFANWLVWRNDLNRPVDLPGGKTTQRIAQTNWWLVINNRFVGEISCRHAFNDFLRTYGGHVGYGVRPSERGKGYAKTMLRLALPEMSKLGLSRVLITAKADNLPSVKVIEACGGVFDGEVTDLFGRSDAPMRRYWAATTG